MDSVQHTQQPRPDHRGIVIVGDVLADETHYRRRLDGDINLPNHALTVTRRRVTADVCQIITMRGALGW